MTDHAKLTLAKPHKQLQPFEAVVPALTVITGGNGAGKSQLLRALKDGTCTVRIIGPNEELPVRQIAIFERSLLAPTFEYSNHGVRERAFEMLRRASGAHLEQVSRIAAQAGVKQEELDDIAMEAFMEEVASSTDGFRSNFAFICSVYQRKIVYERSLLFAAEQGDSVPRPGLAGDKFVERYGRRPWEVLGDALAKHTDFELEWPGWLNTGARRPVELKLLFRKRGAGSEGFPFSELSSGERLMISIVVANIAAKVFSHVLPKLILLDEVDSSLHPSQVSWFLRFLEEEFCGQGTAVAIATHSPSFVALAPEGSVFEVGSGGFAPASKDRAIGRLTLGVPSLRIDFSNTRQVLCESSFDRFVYATVYRAVAHILDPAISLSFLEVGSERGGGCDAVKRLVDDLSGAGVASIRGLLDWDRTNLHGDRVVVLDGRYSVENFAFDPMAIIWCLSKKPEALERHTGLRLLARQKLRQMIEEPDGSRRTLQQAVDLLSTRVWTVMETNHRGEVRDIRDKGLGSGVVESRYVGGLAIDIPDWWTYASGHILASVVFEVFPELRSFSNSSVRVEAQESRVAGGVVADVSGEFCELVPLGFVEAFRRLQAVEH